MNTSILLGLTNNTALLLALGAIYNLLPSRRRPGSQMTRAASGILIGLVCIAIMLNPLFFREGVLFDTRSILLCITGLFLGPVPTVLAASIGAAFRLYTGGVGAWTGVAVILFSAGSGLVWRELRRRWRLEFNWAELYIFGLIVHIGMLLLMFSLPIAIAREVLGAISLPVLAIYPAGTVLLGLLMSQHDKRQKTEHWLRGSEEMLRRVVQNMPVMLDAFDEHQKIIVWNRECERVTGYASDEIVGNPDALRMLYPGTYTTLAAGLAEPAVDFREGEYILNSKSGQPRTISWSSSAHSNPIPGWFGWAIGMDVTERVRALEDLKASEAKYRRIVDTAEEGIWVIDANNRTSFANRKLTEILDCSPAELEGRDLFDFIDEQDRQSAMQNLDRRREGKSGQHDFRFKTAKGNFIWTSLATNPILDEQGHYLGALAMVTDISQRRAAEQALEEHTHNLEAMVRARTDELQRLVNAMAGREIRMAELKGVIRGLKAQLEQAGLQPAIEDPLSQEVSLK